MIGQGGAQQAPINERIAERISLVALFVIAFILLGIALSLMFGNWWFIQKFPALGLFVGALALLIVNWKDFVKLAEIVFHFDFNRDGRIGESAKQEDAESPDEAEFERRMHRALKAITEQGVESTRRSICDKHRIMSQVEWALWRQRCIQTGIFTENGKMLAVSLADAYEKWCERLNGKSSINIGVPGKVNLVPKSGLYRGNA